MKNRIFIIFLIFSVCVLLQASCSARVDNGNAGPVDNTAQNPPTVQQPASPANVRADENGNMINDDGWEIPGIVPKSIVRAPLIGPNTDGEKVKVVVLRTTPENRVAVEGPPVAGGAFEWIVTDMIEFIDNDRKPFCYDFTANAFAKGSNANSLASGKMTYRLCDGDGDGKFETKVLKIKKLNIPTWVKSLPLTPTPANARSPG